MQTPKLQSTMKCRGAKRLKHCPIIFEKERMICSVYTLTLAEFLLPPPMNYHHGNSWPADLNSRLLTLCPPTCSDVGWFCLQCTLPVHAPPVLLWSPKKFTEMCVSSLCKHQFGAQSQGCSTPRHFHLTWIPAQPPETPLSASSWLGVNPRLGRQGHRGHFTGQLTWQCLVNSMVLCIH